VNMETRPLIDNLPELRHAVEDCVVLYSGGLDSSWFLLWARQNGIRATALYVHLGGCEPPAEVAARATKLGADYRVLTLTEVFALNFIAPAIRAGALYQGAYPVCSSLSRPLMAEAAVGVARSKTLNCIVHTTTFMQNSAARFNHALRALAPNIIIANPLIREPIGREDKRRQLATAGIQVRDDIYSIDENIWGRVIECGELDQPANNVPSHIWTLTGDEQPTAVETRSVTLKFEQGLPVGLDGQLLPLAEIIIQLNELGGAYGIGRYNGLEDTPLGLKNHEVREAPAAAIILAAHAALERATLTQREVRVKAAADLEWTDLITNGSWHSPLREALGALISSLSRFVSGEVVVEFSANRAFVSAVRSAQTLDFWNAGQGAEDLYASFSYREYFELATIPLRLRAGCWQPATLQWLTASVRDLP
jgi:argininosuccinate synthase